ncbi:hypothetical protein ACFYWP_21305 [Actinacidiphila glaucinigra]|uniref:hypothetical protein n=1 Tax=Actinacidiphila glaucinigra TaxID=235986 RepID=UPI0036AF305C
MIGAGDAFMAGLLSGLLRAGLLGGAAASGRLRGTADGGSPPPAVAGALELAARVAALTCGRAGADPPFLAEVAPVM